MRSSFFFYARLVFAWLLLLFFVLMVTSTVTHRGQSAIFVVWLFLMIFVITSAVSHRRRVRLINGVANSTALANRQRRQIEMPMDAGRAFDMLEATIRELPNVEQVLGTRDSLQMRAKVRRVFSYGTSVPLLQRMLGWFGTERNQIFAVVTPHGETGTVNLVCEPESGAWRDWFTVDNGTNLENAEAISRAISRRITEARRDEQASTKETETEKELAVAKLRLLHAQVEPHFLYNTLGSAKYLIRSDPDGAERIIDNLILYLRHSLPRLDNSLTTLGEELERVRAYLDIMQIRMGARLKTEIIVPDALKSVPFPTMMLQTLVENSIKHGLEPKSGGGTIWVLVADKAGRVAITVADDGNGFGTATTGSGIGLSNVRERLQLAYGADASFDITANFPAGVAATITVPATGPQRRAMSKSVTCVVAEDEQLFREALLELLRQEWPALQVVAACEDGGAALEAIGEHKPDVAFLDIRMPGLTGLDVAAATAEASPATQIVFVTAYDQYAIQAFERGAVDYLLKPIARDRLVATIARLQGRVGQQDAHGATLAVLLKELGATLPAKPAEAPLAWLTASSGKETRLIMVDDVAYFRSDSKYTTVMTAQGESLLRTPLHELLGKLDPTHFKQIHRSTIVNLRMVAAVTRDDSGRGTMRLRNRPETLPVSLTFMPLFRNM